VDITGAPDEIVRQVFENRSYWRMCNRAMADVYEMPADVDFGQQPVRLYWPRSPANEEFVRRLIEAELRRRCALGGPSPRRLPAYVENDVRASIHNGRMLRMGQPPRCQPELRVQHDAEQRIDALRRVFDAVPDAVLVIDEAGPAAMAQRRLRADSWHHPGRRHRPCLAGSAAARAHLAQRSCSDQSGRPRRTTSTARAFSSARAWPGGGRAARGPQAGVASMIENLCHPCAWACARR
jgi:PAS domain-containing protein